MGQTHVLASSELSSFKIRTYRTVLYQEIQEPFDNGPIMDLAVKITLWEEGDEWSYHFYLWQSFKCFCLCVSYSSIFVKFLYGAHLQHLSGAANNWNKRKLTVILFIMTILSLLMWLPYAAATLFFIFNPVAWNFFLTRNIWFRLEYPLIFLYLMNSLVNSIV